MTKGMWAESHASTPMSRIASRGTKRRIRAVCAQGLAKSGSLGRRARVAISPGTLRSEPLLEVSAVRISRPSTVLHEQGYNRPLLLHGGRAPAATPPGVLNRQVEWRRAASILAQRIGAVREKNTNCVRTARSDRPMQWRDFALVH